MRNTIARVACYPAKLRNAGRHSWMARFAIDRWKCGYCAYGVVVQMIQGIPDIRGHCPACGAHVVVTFEDGRRVFPADWKEKHMPQDVEIGTPPENMKAPGYVGSNAKEYAETRDPWAHRSQGMRCVTCMWYVGKPEAAGTVKGRCRRHAPTMNGYPVVFPNDWCGDHKLA